ncbi:hypothetical protein C8F01DRAFT_737553 [Mycena amicta]|nr:hypothetical protein C8F01DRAFT_737553 [Mycena amicta]
MDAPEALSRRPSLRGRPNAAPMGPRTRIVSRSSGFPSRESTLYPQGAAPVYTPDPSESKALPTVMEREYPVIQDLPPSTRSSPSIPETLNVRAIPRVAALTPPPQINFDSVPVQWKGVPLDAALWTLDSKELQEIVSRAIRNSSRESFIRVLSLDTLDSALPAELDRLNTLKSVTQSKYRFTVHRRTMLLQALRSFSSYNDREKDVEGISKLTSQLSQTTSQCDQLLEELLKTNDQIGQLTHLQDAHFASALAIAIRKLNSSYGRRTADLIKAREKITSLQAELSDAWQQAENLAREMDELDIVSDDDEAVIEVAEVISLNHRKSPSGSSGPSLQPIADVLSLDAISRMHSQATSPVSPSASHTTQPPPPASPTQTKLPSPSLSEMGLDIALPDTDTASVISARSTRSAKSVRSTRSTRTTRSQRTVETSRVSSVSAARRRSQRTSMSSLRMPSIRSAHRNGSHPPVPSLPSSSKSPTPDGRSSRVESFLDFGSGSRDATDEDTDDTDSAVRRPTTIEEIQVVARTPTKLVQTRDDIHLMPSRSAAERDLVAARRSQFSLDRQHPFANEDSVNHSIPSIWLMQDTPKTTTERVDSMRMRERGHVKMGSLQRLKSLTKRYSLPFPAAIQNRSKSTRNVTGS